MSGEADHSLVEVGDKCAESCGSCADTGATFCFEEIPGALCAATLMHGRKRSVGGASATHTIEYNCVKDYYFVMPLPP